MSDERLGSSFDVIGTDRHSDASATDSATGKNPGHMHSLNRQGPLSEWMNSECRHPEQRLARLGARLAFVMGAHRRLGALPRHRPIGAASFRPKDLFVLAIGRR